jgi:hypothetical protein
MVEHAAMIATAQSDAMSGSLRPRPEYVRVTAVEDTSPPRRPAPVNVRTSKKLVEFTPLFLPILTAVPKSPTPEMFELPVCCVPGVVFWSWTKAGSEDSSCERAGLAARWR